MPKSKRDKKVSLTKTDKKGLALKQRIVDDVRSCVEKYNSVYVFTCDDMRNEKMKEIREEWKPSRFFFGKNKVIAVGLGRNKEEEVQDDIHKLSAVLKGSCALLFTDSKEKEVVDWFDNFEYQDYARAGYTATQTIELEAGPLAQFSHAMEPHLRQLGLPTKLERGVVTLISDFTVCKEGQVLTPQQAKIVEYLEIKLADFKLTLVAGYQKGKGFKQFKSITNAKTDGGDDAEQMDDNDDA